MTLLGLCHPWISFGRQNRALLAERMENCATDELDRKLAALLGQQGRLEHAGWFS